MANAASKCGVARPTSSGREGDLGLAAAAAGDEKHRAAVLLLVPNRDAAATACADRNILDGCSVGGGVVLNRELCWVRNGVDTGDGTPEACLHIVGNMEGGMREGRS